MKKLKIGPDGLVYRDGETVVVEILKDLKIKDLPPGVICVNPREPRDRRILRKVFRRKKIYLPGEYDLAVANHISRPGSTVISMNGYSSLKLPDLIQYGVKPGAYEAACKAVLRAVLRHLRAEFPAAVLQIVDGASDMGVDQAIAEVAVEFGIPTLGFSCPGFMIYVPDDDRPVYVGESKDAYGDCFIRSLDLLITTGGRGQALKHDIFAACLYGKKIHFVDLMGMLSSNGGVPATVTKPDGRVVVENAAAAFGNNISFFSNHAAIALAPQHGDKWDALFGNVEGVATQVCRSRMSPEHMFRV
jgi:hypothetical protein